MENVNVVIVDDNPMILNTLDEVISSEAGLSVIGRADNGKDAIDMIKDTQPDVVLLDLVMPQMDGITVVENIKKKTSMLKNPAFIILSAVGGEQMTEEAFQAGANYFLMKPFDKDILVNKIRRIGKRPVRPVPEGLRSTVKGSNTGRSCYEQGRIYEGASGNGYYKNAP